MFIRVTLGEPMCRNAGGRDQEIEFPGDAPDAAVTLMQLASRLGLKLADAEGALLIILNGELIPPGKIAEYRLHDGDHVELHMMLTGG